MTRRLGDTLIRDGSITTAELGLALGAQKNLGGLLGTNLLELGVLSERELGEALAGALRVRYGSPELLERMEPEAAKSYPRWLALKHHAVPIRSQGEMLHVLVSSPRRLCGLSTRTGLRLTPWIAPSIRVSQAIHRAYGVPLGARESEILQQLSLAAAASAAVDAGPSASDELLARRMCRVDNGRDAIELALDSLCAQLAHVVLFRVQDDLATVWDVRGPHLDRDNLAELELPVQSGSLLELLSVYPTYAGNVPREPGCRVFFDQLGIPVPREMLLAPIRVGTRVVSILYADAGSESRVRHGGSDPLWLARKLAVALNVIAVRNSKSRLSA